jgi:transcriptional regulator with XRE-family HTH domain
VLLTNQQRKRSHTLYFSSSTLHDLLVENPITEQVGARVAKVRGQMEMTQAELASEMTTRLGREIRPLTVTRLEGGKRPIGVDELVVIAEALHVKPDDLLSEDGSLPMGSAIIISRWQSMLRASNILETAVREYVSARQRMLETLSKYPDKKFRERLPAVTRAFVDRAVSDWTVDFIVAEAQKTEQDQDDNDSDT